MIDELLIMEPSEQSEVQVHPETQGCHLLTLIKKQRPSSLIRSFLRLHQKEAILKYRTRKNRSLLYYALLLENEALIEELFPWFNYASFHEYTSNGTTTMTIIKRMKDEQLRKYIEDQVQLKDKNEYLED